MKKKPAKSTLTGSNLPRIVSGLRKQVVSLGQIHYNSKQDVNFKEWAQRTLYLIKAGFGEGSRYDDVESAIDEMPEKNTTKWSDGAQRYVYWLERKSGSAQEEEEDDEIVSSRNATFNQRQWDSDYQKAKGWLQKLLKLCVEELDLLTPEEPKVSKGAKNTLIATQITSVQIDLKSEIKNLVNFVHENEADSEKADDVASKIRELGTELEKESTKWSAVKDIIIWIANYSKDLFVKVLPILLDHYGKH